MTEEERLYVRMVAKEAAEAAIDHAMSNGLLPKLREEARGVAQTAVTEHVTACEALRQKDTQVNVWKLVAIVAVCSTGGGGIASAIITHFVK